MSKKQSLADNPISNDLQFYTVSSTPLSQKDRLSLGYKHLGNNVYQNLNYNPEDKADYQFASYVPIPKGHPQYDPKVGTAYGFYKVADPNAPEKTQSIAAPAVSDTSVASPQVIPPPIVDKPKRQVDFTADGQKITNPDGSIEYYDRGGKSVKPIVNNYKMGGLVKKYAAGGWVDKDGNPVNDVNLDKYTDEEKAQLGYTKLSPKSGLVSKFGQTGLYSVAGNAAGSLAQNAINKNGETIGGDAVGGTLRGAGAGAQIGSNFGPEGTALGAVIGGGAGLVSGIVKGKKDRTQRTKALEQESVNSALANQYSAGANTFNPYASTNYNANDYKTKLGVQGLKGGGKVVGKGGPKTDSIPAKVKKDSFVVPAENAELAEEVREKVLKDKPSKKANLNQKGGEDVKLSDEEHLFTPKEVKEIEEELGEGFLDELAPDADSETSNKSSGGRLSAEKAAEILKDGTVHGNPITDRQRRYFGYVMSQRKADGGLVEEDSGGDDYARKVKEYTNKKQRAAKKNSPNNIDDPYSLEKIRPSKTNDPYSREAIENYKSGLANKLSRGKKPIGQSLADKLRFSPSSLLGEKSGEDVVVPENRITTPVNVNTTTNPRATTRDDYTNPANQQSGTPALTDKAKTKVGLADVLGYGQSALGAGLLLNQKRPTYEPTNEFKSQLGRTLSSSSYGYTPEQKSLLNNQIVQKRNQGLGLARALSGGSASDALVNSRKALNDSYSDKLNLASQDESLRMNKMGLANQMANLNEGVRRQIFDDKLNAFQQNMGAGSALLSSGLENILGADRYRQSKLAAQQISKYNL